MKSKNGNLHSELRTRGISNYSLAGRIRNLSLNGADINDTRIPRKKGYVYSLSEEEKIKRSIDSIFDTAQNRDDLEKVSELFYLANQRKYNWVVDYQIKGSKIMRRLVNEGNYKLENGNGD